MRHYCHYLIAVVLVVAAYSDEPAVRPSSASFTVAISPADGLAVWHESYMLDTATGTQRLIGVSLDADHDGVIDTSIGFTRVTAAGATIMVVEQVKPALSLRVDAASERDGSPLKRERPAPEHTENTVIRTSDGYKLALRLLAK